MSEVPSIKGSVMAGHIHTLLKLRDGGQISKQYLERALSNETLTMLDHPIQASAWYDIRSYTQIMELLRDVAGGGDNEYFCKAGAASAERLLQMGFYQQLEYLKRMRLGDSGADPYERFVAYGHDLRMIATITSSLVNFGPMTVKRDPEHEDRYLTEIVDAENYPDVLGWATQGFGNRLAIEYGAPGLWKYERPQRNLVLHRMTYTI
jgi:hypothetical protein